MPPTWYHCGSWLTDAREPRGAISPRSRKGEDARIDFVKDLEHRYGKIRVAGAKSLPLVDESGQRESRETVWYHRGGWAFWMLMQAVGRAEMFYGLHAFVETFMPGVASRDAEQREPWALWFDAALLPVL